MLVCLIATFFVCFAASFPKVLKKIPNPTVSIVISETFLDLVLLHILQSPLNKLIFFPVVLLKEIAGLLLIVDECCSPPTQ